MTDLLPDFRGQLEARAQQLSDDHARRGRLGVRRLHGRGLAVAIFVAASGIGGVAYASLGLWSPPLGNERGGRSVATASPLPADQLKALGVFRRPQNARDRGASSRLALTMTGGGAVIRTNEVRRLATGQNGGAVVLVPFARKKGIDFDAIRRARVSGPPLKAGDSLPEVTRRDQVCLTYVDSFEGAGVTCVDTDGLLAGRLALGESNPQCIVAQQRRDFAKAQERERRLAAAERRPAVKMTCDRSRSAPSTIHTVGVVPDGVAAIRLGDSPRSTVVPVHGNVWQTDRGSLLKQVWLDDHGRVLSKRLADTRRRLGLAPR